MNRRRFMAALGFVAAVCRFPLIIPTEIIRPRLTHAAINDKIQSSQTVFFENGVFPSMIATVGK